MKESLSLNLNESLMFAIQQTTNDSTTKIMTFFYNISLKQVKAIKDIASDKDVYYKLKKNYGYYPNTKLYFVVSTIKKTIMDYHYGIDKIIWETTVTMPTTTLKLPNQKLLDVMVESELLGDVEPSFGEPDNSKVRKKFNLEELDKNRSELKKKTEKKCQNKKNLKKTT